MYPAEKPFNGDGDKENFLLISIYPRSRYKSSPSEFVILTKSLA